MTDPKYAPDPRDSPQLAGVVERNIRALLARQQLEDRRKRLSERVADAVTRFTGSMTFVYIHLALFGTWILVNLGVTPLPRFDPSFVILAMAASVEAIFLSTFVLISQNRAMAENDKRDDLDLHINLLTEHELTRLIEMVAAIAKKLEVRSDADQEIG